MYNLKNSGGSPHTFHIPVMGLAYTIDSPIKVARYGINSVISIIQDNLIEKMRSYYYPFIGLPYSPISIDEKNYRSRRITDYLNLVNMIVSQQVEKLRNSDFHPGSEIYKYFEMLPDENKLKELFNNLLTMGETMVKRSTEDTLRSQIQAGSIDVNIMTKLDKDVKDKEGNIIEDGSTALTALKGYADSDLENSTIILSAGMNPRLYNYMATFDAFDSDQNGAFKKKIAIKVTDYRSAFIQGRMLAKKGLWVSEFRIESGLNCGGHAFASDGFLLGPILEEFKTKKTELVASLFELFKEALITSGKVVPSDPPPIQITVQGGIGTNREDEFLRKHYNVNSTGWGTPFLLVPEATTVDKTTLNKLSHAGEKDVILSNKSPLGIRFHYLKGTTADEERIKRNKDGKPGSPCTEKYLQFNSEFGPEGLCTASSRYQKKKIKELESMNLSEFDYNKQRDVIVDKDCLCIGLSNSAIHNYKLAPFVKLEAVNICPGPNIAYFTQVIPLKKMIDHIYGRDDLLVKTDRPHVFIKELSIYVDYWKELLSQADETINKKRKAYLKKFNDNLLQGIAYYRKLSNQITDDTDSIKTSIVEGLTAAELQITRLYSQFIVERG